MNFLIKKISTMPSLPRHPLERIGERQTHRSGRRQTPTTKQFYNSHDFTCADKYKVPPRRSGANG